MMALQPFHDLVPQTDRKRPHGSRIGVRHSTGPLVTRDVALFSKGIERRNNGGVDAHRLTQGLCDSVAVRIPRRPVAGRCKRRGGHLERGVVGDVQPPVSAETLGRAVVEIALDDLQEIANFVLAGLVPCQPAVSLPVRQAHRFPQQ